MPKTSEIICGNLECAFTSKTKAELERCEICGANVYRPTAEGASPTDPFSSYIKAEKSSEDLQKKPTPV